MTAERDAAPRPSELPAPPPGAQPYELIWRGSRREVDVTCGVCSLAMAGMSRPGKTSAEEQLRVFSETKDLKAVTRMARPCVR